MVAEMLSKEVCRVCNSNNLIEKFHCDGPSITSIKTLLPVAVSIFGCQNCGHLQKPNLKKIEKFYDTEYKISMESADHDQVYRVNNGKILYRVDQQVEILKKIELGTYSNVLDFGAGKGVTLKNFADFRSDLCPYVYDVSKDYKSYWDTWLPNERQSVYKIPSSWLGTFDLITSFFVFEHLDDPLGKLISIKKLLRDGALFLLTVPNSSDNTGDLLVADHLNHFNEESLNLLFSRAGFKIKLFDKKLFDGAYVVLARNMNEVNDKSDNGNIPNLISEQEKALKKWETIIQKIEKFTVDPPIAIYGAGFYGALVSTKLNQKPEIFLDRNEFLYGKRLFDVPIMKPEDCPSNIKTIIISLNPSKARDIISENDNWIPNGTKILYLDD